MKNEVIKRSFYASFSKIFCMATCIAVTAAFAATSEKFEPDIEFVKQLATMSYPDVIAKLNQLPPDKNLKYCLIMAKLQSSRNNRTAAMQYCNYALEISQKNNLEECEIYLIKAFVNDSTTDRLETINNLDKATDCFRKNNDVNSLKVCLSATGGILYSYGDFKKSLKAYNEVLQICEETNDILVKAETLFDIGEVYSRIADIPNARKSAEQAKIIFEKSGNTKGLADCLKLLGNTCVDDAGKAKKYYVDACKLYEETNDHHGLANCCFNLGIMSSGRKEYSDSIDYLNRALHAYTKAGSVEGVGIANMELGRCYFLMKDYDKSEMALNQACQFLNGVSQFRLAQTKDYQGDLYTAKGDFAQALDCYKLSVELYKTTGLGANIAIEEEKIKNLNNRITGNK